MHKFIIIFAPKGYMNMNMNAVILNVVVDIRCVDALMINDEFLKWKWNLI